MRIKGKVKFYSKFKRYGFIVDENDNEYIYFANKIEEGKKVPKRKDIVYFTPLEGKRGWKAKDIDVFVEGQVDKFKCPECHNVMFPRLIEKERSRGYFITNIKKAAICPKCHYEFENHLENEQENISLIFKLMFLGVLTLLIVGLFFIRF